jgi:hypothetical protein
MAGPVSWRGRAQPAAWQILALALAVLLSSQPGLLLGVAIADPLLLG